MTERNKAQVVKRALQRLFVVAGTEEPKAEDAQLVSDIYDVLRLELADSGIGGVEPNSVPLNLFEGVAALLAARSANDFGITESAARLEAEGWQRCNSAASFYTGAPAKLNTY